MDIRRSPRSSHIRRLRVERLEDRLLLATSDAYEPDNSPSLAAGISTSGAAQQRSLTAGDIDWIRFSIGAKSDATIRVSSDRDFEPVVELYRADDTTSAIDPQCGQLWFESNHILEPGDYLARIFTYNGALDRYSVSVTAVPSPADLSRVNFVQLAGEGFNSHQYLPSGELAQLLWFGNRLVYRQRSLAGAVNEEHVLTRFGCSSPFDARDFSDAHLLINSAGAPQIIVANDGELQHYQRDAGGWRLASSFELPSSSSSFSLFVAQVAAAIGPDDDLHVMITVEDWNDYQVGEAIYATNRSGPWVQETALPQVGTKTYGWQSTHTIRYLSMAIDAQGKAHLTFTPEFREPVYNDWGRPFNQLAYATNRAGSWETRIIHQPSDDSGESGVGASIAIGPDNQPAIAQFYVERVPTGSASYSHLLYHRRNLNGSWSSQTVTTAPDRYAAGDGAKFTGFAPHLLFDGTGRPHIAFSDYASQHFASTGADEFAGQIRHAVRDGSQWKFATVYAQSDPLRNQMQYPSMALSSTEITFVGIRKADVLLPDLTVAESNHYFVLTSIPQMGLTISPSTSVLTERGQVTVTIARHHSSTTGPLLVTLSGDATEVNWPATITIPAGATSVTTTLLAVDDQIVDGDQRVRLRADASGFQPGQFTIRINDLRDVIIRGVVFRDTNIDGRQAVTESTVAGATVYLDLNSNGQLDSNEPSVETNEQGRFELVRSIEGVYRLAVRLPEGWIQTAPAANSYHLATKRGDSYDDLLFGGLLEGLDTATGVLTIAARESESLRLEAIGNAPRTVSLNRNGQQDPRFSTIRATDLTFLQLMGGAGDNRIDLSPVTPAEFPNLGGTFVRDPTGNDQLLGSSVGDWIDLSWAEDFSNLNAPRLCGVDSVDSSWGDDSIMLCDVENIQIAGGDGRDSLLVDRVGQQVDLAKLSAMTGIEHLSSRGTTANQLSLGSSTAANWSSSGQATVFEVDFLDSFAAGSGWLLVETRHEAGSFVHIAASGDVRVRLKGTSYLQNPLRPADVNHDGNLVALDAILVINQLNDRAATFVVPASFPIEQTVALPLFLDVSGDGRLVPLDAILVINALNAIRRSGEGEFSAFGLMVPYLPDSRKTEPDLIVASERKNVSLSAGDRRVAARVLAGAPLFEVVPATDQLLVPCDRRQCRAANRLAVRIGMDEVLLQAKIGGLE